MKFTIYTRRDLLKATGLGLISMSMPSFPLHKQIQKHKSNIIRGLSS